MEHKIVAIQRVLDALYPSPPVPLNNLNDFTFLVAVVLSAQTTDGKVNDVTKELFMHAATPQAMSQLSESFILSIIQPVGLAPKKASYVRNLSIKLVDEFDGKVPASFAELESLPGVGHKTASVIMSQIFGIPSIAVDTHVHRLALRWGLSRDQKNVDNVQKDLCRLFPENCWNKLHLQMIYFGREFCTAKAHEDAGCPVCSWVHRKEGLPAGPLVLFEPKRPTKNIVYYADRVRELENKPTLAYHSPHKVTSAKILHDDVGNCAATATMLGIAAEGKEACGDAAASAAVRELAGAHMQLLAPPHLTRKRKASVMTALSAKKEDTENIKIKVESVGSAVKARGVSETKTTDLATKQRLKHEQYYSKAKQ